MPEKSKKQQLIDFVVEWCRDNAHGYSQVNRWGPDCDCSSLMYMAASAAGYQVPTKGSRNTGTMLQHFQEAGFSAIAFDGVLDDCGPGSILLNVENHTELMVDWNTFGGAHIDEHGEILGSCPGDQTGNEVSIAPAYVPSYGWDYVLIPPSEDNSAPHGDRSDHPVVLEPRYRVKTAEDGWLTWMQGLSCSDMCGDDYAGIIGHVICAIEIDWQDASGWFQLRTSKSPDGLEKNCSGDGSGVVGVTVYYETQSPGTTGWYRAKYRVSPKGNSYYKWEYDDEDEYAGDLTNPIDRIQITLEGM